ncbi:mechanosensitive ion channel family protein [Prevotella veroralis]|uniref:Transporter, small conductance mechanosensitive ion channel MscS family protein n=1 Tax=Prevotella veroralis F0319 TaxID=649761 RepID=C9MQ70_9BACT|nr:mechanosensitive ion channel family protein [Prevotella veroralis]EEX18326.1 transporter, small conductance mechanosensitive ion channel MscS family protein [Prevotella veroralis F0319]QUB41246.1 mechanosensitive ion channel family protein [Prevotella veroralis]
MYKKIFFITILLFIITLPASAVLQEDSLKNSLSVLRHELIAQHLEQTKQLNNSKFISEQVMNQLKEIGEHSAQVSLMLYSQKTDNIFDLTYACQEATELWKDFQSKSRPFHDLITESKEEIARYDSLINVLSTMYTFGMTDKMKTDRNVCLTLAVSIRRMLQERNDSYQEYIQYYQYNQQQLQSLDTYAQKRYEEIQTSIFTNSGVNYFKFLRNAPTLISQMSSNLSEKYTPQRVVQSQWDVRWLITLFSMILIYGLVAILINYLSIRFLVTKVMKTNRFEQKNSAFLAKRTCIIMVTSIITFSIILVIIKILSPSNFVHMACNLLLEYTWLLTVIFASLLLRVSGAQTHNTYRIYYPLIFVGFTVITFRIVMLPSSIVTLVFPPLLLLNALWQARMIYKHRLQIPKYDLYLAYFSLTVFVFSLISSIIGYTMLGVQVFIWWMMQLACILTIAFFHDYLDQYRERHPEKKLSIVKTWLFRFIYNVFIPSAVVLSFIISIYWATDVFNLSDMTWKLFRANFIDSDKFKISIYSIAVVTILWFIFNYLNHTIRDAIKQFLKKSDPTTAAARGTMFINVLQVVVWGAWLLTTLSIFKISNTWLVVVTGGLSTGIGFAMKDILENIYYGISLMTGRIKIGDYIVCDGIRGRVSSISYTSTMLEALDGSIIAFQNSQLFTKNYKNMTKNHGYELDILEVGVAYGSNINEVKKMLIEAITALNITYKKKEVMVLLKSFDDSCITLKVLVWVNVFTQGLDDSIIMECIYDTLNKNGIEIPFPQREITIKNQ